MLGLPVSTKLNRDSERDTVTPPLSRSDRSGGPGSCDLKWGWTLDTEGPGTRRDHDQIASPLSGPCGDFETRVSGPLVELETSGNAGAAPVSENDSAEPRLSFTPCSAWSLESSLNLEMRCMRVSEIASRSFQNTGYLWRSGQASRNETCRSSHRSRARTSAERTHRFWIVFSFTFAARIRHMFMMASSPKHAPAGSRSSSRPLRVQLQEPRERKYMESPGSPLRVTKCSDCTTRGSAFCAMICIRLGSTWMLERAKKFSSIMTRSATPSWSMAGRRGRSSISRTTALARTAR
mmetsp:Transcript_20410/g.41330  ORF Transcript_20410/g.41330 Transcript_20410/m.41330 type:complete len:293 (+) Transcript_20410:121-999(+)